MNITPMFRACRRLDHRQQQRLVARPEQRSARQPLAAPLPRREPGRLHELFSLSGGDPLPCRR